MPLSVPVHLDVAWHARTTLTAAANTAGQNIPTGNALGGAKAAAPSFDADAFVGAASRFDARFNPGATGGVPIAAIFQTDGAMPASPGTLTRGLSTPLNFTNQIKSVAAAQPSPGDKIAAGALAYRGQSTRNGPSGGRLACAYSVNQILRRQGFAPIGTNPNYVPSVESALKERVRAGTATVVPPGHERPGDIVVARNQSHVGIAIGGGRVLSNSSSRRAFSWESGMNFDGQYGGGASRVYRLRTP